MARSATSQLLVRLTLAAAAIAGFVLLTRPPAPEPARVEMVEVVYGDPFAMRWETIDESLDDTLVPMVSDDTRCIGFARSDWEGTTRQPSVARCLPDDGPSSPATVGVRNVAAGFDTWRFLFFAEPVRTIDLEVDGRATEVAVRDTIATAVTPTGAGALSLTWTDRTGRRYRTELEP